MPKHEVKFEKEDFERLLDLMNSGEASFSVLALHSLIEREMENVTGLKRSADDKQPVCFNELCDNFLSVFDTSDAEEKVQKEIIKALQNQRKVTNNVEHKFQELTPQEISLYATVFLDFVAEYNPETKKFSEYSQLEKLIDDVLHDDKQVAVVEDLFKKHQKACTDFITQAKNYTEALKEKSDLEKNLLDTGKEKAKQKENFNAQKTKLEKERKEQKNIKSNKEKDIAGLSSRLNNMLRSYKNPDAEKMKSLQFQLSQKKKELGEAEKEIQSRNTEIEKLNRENNQKMQELNTKMESYRKRLSEKEPIIDAWAFEQRFFLYAMNRHAYLKKKRELTREQKEVVAAINDKGDFLIRGGAGSGKTFVLLEALLERSQGRLITSTCRFITFTKSLTEFSNTIYPSLAIENSKISTVDSYICSMAKTILRVNIAYKGEDDTIKEAIQAYKDKGNTLKDKQIEDIINELKDFIWARNVKKDEYLSPSCQRRGMKENKSIEERKEVWEILEIFEQKRTEEYKKEWPREYTVTKLLDAYEKNPGLFEKLKCDYIFIDECQDLSMSTLTLLKKMSKVAVYLAGDFKQTIYRKAKYNLIEAGINIRGRSVILSECRRSTRQISEFSETYKKLAGLEIKDEKEPSMTSITIGPPVQYFEGNSVDDCLNHICQQIPILTSFGVSKKAIVIIAYSGEQIEAIGEKLKGAGIAWDKIGGQSDKDKEENKEKEKSFTELMEADSVKLVTIHSIKGLEFPCVIFYGSESTVSSMSPEAEKIIKRNLVYTSLTRASIFLDIIVDKSVKSDAISLIGETRKSLGAREEGV